MERGYAPSRRAPLREPPMSGAFYRTLTLVSGGSGIVGHALIGRILREGGTIIAPVRTTRSADKLQRMLEDNAPTQRLKTVVGDYTTGAGAHTLVTWLNSHAQAGLDHVVSIHGGETPSAKLLDVKGGDFRDTMHTKVLPHIVLAQACIPHLIDKQESSYTVVTGRMGEECMKTDEALLCIANAASFGVAAALRAQMVDAEVAARINEVRIGAVIRRDEAEENPAFPGWVAMPASRLASVLVQEMLGTTRNKVIHVSEEDIKRAPEEEEHEEIELRGGGARGIAITPVKVSGKIVGAPTELGGGAAGAKVIYKERGGETPSRAAPLASREA